MSSALAVHRGGSLLSADSNITDLLQMEHPEIFAGIGGGYTEKSGFQRKVVISLKRGKAEPRLLLRTNGRATYKLSIGTKINDLG